MSERISLLILTATNLRTSTGSLNTVLNILDNLDEKKYQISICLLDSLIPPRLKISLTEFKKDPTYVPFDKIKSHKKISKIYSLETLTIDQLKKLFDIAIVAIYNEFGEDGKTIGLLELAGIPYLSPGLNSSVVAFDKEFAKAVLRNNNISTPKSVQIFRDASEKMIRNQIGKNLSYPVIVKPTSNGASRGTSLVKTSSRLYPAIKAALNFSSEVLVEEYISGNEFTVGVMGHYTDPVALPPVMIKSKNDFFDYKAKYVKGYAEEICPAPISKELESKLKVVAVKSYRAIKASNHSRVDMIERDGKIYVLEVNSFPGLVASSLFPKELNAAGITLSEFLDNSIASKLL